MPYFHVVFHAAHELNPLIAQNQVALYKLLFDTASAVLLEFGRNRFKAADWNHHRSPHLEPNPGRSLSPALHRHRWRSPVGWIGWAKVPETLPVPGESIEQEVPGQYRAGLQRLFEAGELEFHGRMEASGSPGAFRKLLWRACREKWVIYAKRPFAGPEQVIAYLARYTHRVGITNNRIKHLDERRRRVTFQYRDSADRHRQKQMTLSLDEFVRRFRLHILPARFVKIRHYGLLSNRTRSEKVAEARKALGVEPSELEELLARAKESREPPGPKCPHCQSEKLLLVRVILPPWRIAGHLPEE